jgi:hypothetical protein
MTLENLLRIGKLRAHAVTRLEIERLLSSADQAIADAEVAGLSAGTRLDAAYRAIMQGSLIAMLAHGYRPATGEAGHHQLLIQALPKTLGLSAERVRVLDAFRAARNQSDYEGKPVSDAMIRECIGEARRLLEEVRDRLKQGRPDLL